jgi:integrase/DNA-binding CsgD family transcriptional regulator
MKPTKTPLQPFIDLYLRNHVAQLTVAVAKEQTSTIRRYFGPLLGTKLERLTPIQIEDWFHRIGTTSHSMANRSLSILRTMFGRARGWRLFSGENPAAWIKKYKEHSRKRFVQPDEMPRVMAALRQQTEATQCYFLLCLLVGCRRTEGLMLRWMDLDMQNSCWHKPHTKTDRAQTVPIPKALLDRLHALPRRNEFVFATKRGHWSTSLAFERWCLIRSQAGIPDVTIHDLRRTCASWLACHGENLAIIGNVLNHSGLQHTAIYARLNISPVSRALEENSVRMLPDAPPLPIAEASNERISPPRLSAREREVLARFAQGESCTDIGARLGVSYQTIQIYRARLLKKLQLTDMDQLIRYAIEHEVVDMPLPVSVQPDPPTVSAAPVVSPMMPAPVPIVHRSHRYEREEWPG